MKPMAHSQYFRSVLWLDDFSFDNYAIRWRWRAIRDDEVVDQHQYPENHEAPCRAAEDTNADGNRHESDDP